MRAGSDSDCQPSNYIGLFVYSQDGLLHEGCDFLCGKSLVVDADVVDQAGEEGGCIKVSSGAKIQTTNRLYPAYIANIHGNLRTIYIQPPFHCSTIIHKADVMPLIICDHRLRLERAEVDIH